MSVLLQNVTVSYQRRPAVHHVSGRICAGVATAIVGPNGAGKSTLLKAIAGVLPVDNGHVVLSECLQNELAYLPQKAEIDLSMPMTVFELVATGLWRTVGAFARVSAAGLARIEQALMQVGMQDFSARPLQALSIGQLQRVLFARILVQDAPVILLDEPFNAVDASTTEVLLGLLRCWQIERRTVVAVLHDFEQVKRYFQEVVLLAHEVVAWGKPAEVLTVENLMSANERCAHWFDRGEVCHTEVVAPISMHIDPMAHEHCGHMHPHNEEGA
ncbi:MAG: transporter [Burkholderiaceae bacterium]|nr:transporter [Burkholderiaceae bacterium]